MEFKKTLAQRIFRISKITNQSLTNCRISNPAILSPIPKNPNKSNIASDQPGDNGIFRRLFHKRALFQPSISPEKLRSMQIGENMMEKLRSFDIAKDRIRLDGLKPPEIKDSDEAVGLRREKDLTVADARKLLRVAQLEMVKSRLREVESGWMGYSDFVRICAEGCSDPEQGIRVAKMLDESGSVIVLGNVVFLKPEQVVKAIGGLIPLPATNPNDPRRKELEEMEKQKAAIDRKAETLVRRELWCGLGYMVVQTAAFMRLTFWELTWDVMEPICFYVTSMYCMAGYAFFLRTSKEPSFEGFYQSRFIAKQQKLMKLHNFDAKRYHELLKICYPQSGSTSGQVPGTIATC